MLDQRAINFDRITFFYDAMACVASFNQINRSQLAFIGKLTTQASCLIVGGGSGYFLQELLKINKTIHVTYVETSAKMIASTQKRLLKQFPDELHRITFMCEPIEDVKPAAYDIIVCNYFLDLFEDAYVDTQIVRLKKQMNEDGLLYITDFSMPQHSVLRGITRIGLKTLYWLFRQAVYLPARKLPAIDQLIKENGFVVSDTKLFLRGILTCTMYKNKSFKRDI